MSAVTHETAEELYTETQRLHSVIERKDDRITDLLSEQRLLIDQRDALTRERDAADLRIRELEGTLAGIVNTARSVMR